MRLIWKGAGWPPLFASSHIAHFGLRLTGLFLTLNLSTAAFAQPFRLNTESSEGGNDLMGTLSAYVQKDGTLVIPETIEGNPVTHLGWRELRGCLTVENIRIPKTIISIVPGVFRGCVKLTQFTVDPLNPKFSSRDGVLFNKDQSAIVRFPTGRKGGYIIPRGVIEISASAFGGCTQLTNATFTQDVVLIRGGAFSFCTQLREIILPDSVVSVGNIAFGGCTNLTNAVLSRNLTSSGYCIFWNCQTLHHVTIPEGVKEIGQNAFAQCYSLTNIVQPNSVTKISSGAFSECTNLTNVTLSSNLKSIGRYAFSQCTRLVCIEIGKNVSLIQDMAFADCTLLSRVYFEGNAPALSSNAVFKADSHAIIYHRPEARGWEPIFGERPTALWTESAHQ